MRVADGRRLRAQPDQGVEEKVTTDVLCPSELFEYAFLAECSVETSAFAALADGALARRQCVLCAYLLAAPRLPLWRAEHDMIL